VIAGNLRRSGVFTGLYDDANFYDWNLSTCILDASSTLSGRLRNTLGEKRVA